MVQVNITRMSKIQNHHLQSSTSINFLRDHFSTSSCSDKQPLKQETPCFNVRSRITNAITTGVCLLRTTVNLSKRSGSQTIPWRKALYSTVSLVVEYHCHVFHHGYMDWSWISNNHKWCKLINVTQFSLFQRTSRNYEGFLLLFLCQFSLRQGFSSENLIIITR